MIKTNKQTKSVYCYELRKSYGSIAEASRDTGASASSISACCKGKQATAGGYRWCYFEVGGKSVYHAERKASKVRKVKCVETGRVYASAAEASRKTGVSASGISACCRGDQKTSGDYHWVYAY